MGHFRWAGTDPVLPLGPSSRSSSASSGFGCGSDGAWGGAVRGEQIRRRAPRPPGEQFRGALGCQLGAGVEPWCLGFVNWRQLVLVCEFCVAALR